MQLWRHLVRWKSGVPAISTIDMDDLARQYLTALPSPVCACLSPWHVIRLVPVQPQPAGTIWQNALQAGVLPTSISFEAFSEALSQLAPLFVSVSMTPAGRSHWDAIVGWQPWVPQEWRERQKGRDNISGGVKRDALEDELCDVVPTYFVPSSLVQEQMRLRQSRAVASTALEWQQLMTPSLASLLEWSSDYSVVRLSSRVQGGGTANVLYGFREQVDVFHQALNALALVLPTFGVLEKRVRHVYKTHFVDAFGMYCSDFGPEFVKRFPDARVLLDHPDLQFAMQRDGSGCVMLHPRFLHASRGVPDALYSLGPPTRRSPIYEEESRHPRARSLLHITLPYISCFGDEATLRSIQQERLIGMHCVFDEDADRFSLSVATTHGDIVFVECAGSSLRSLSTSGIQHCGIPVEIADALASPQVVKVVALESTSREDRITEDVRLASLLRQRLNVDVQTICSLRRWALFVGYPFHSLSALSMSFYRRLLARLGVTTTTTTTPPPPMATAHLAAKCASRLLALHELEGYCLDTATLHQMLLDCCCCCDGVGDAAKGSEEAWLLRNLEMRIRRYGVVPCKGGTTLQARQLLLQHLSSLYGPEVFVFDGEPKLLPLAKATSDEEKPAAQPMKEEVGEVEKHKEEYCEADEEALIDALCPALSAACGDGQCNTEAEMEAFSTSEEGKAPQTPDDKRKAKVTWDKRENDVLGDDEAADAGVDTGIKPPPMSDISHKVETKKGTFSESPHFIISPPSLQRDCHNSIRMKPRSTSLLPPAFSASQASSAAFGHEGSSSSTSSHPTQTPPGAAPTQWRFDDVEMEGKMIGYLTREILQESRKCPGKNRMSGRHILANIENDQHEARLVRESSRMNP